jgi:hypothetical protein
MIAALVALVLVAGVGAYIAHRSGAFKRNPPTNPPQPPRPDPNDDPRTR